MTPVAPCCTSLSVGLEYKLKNDFSLQTGIGKVISNDGNLDANILEANLFGVLGPQNKAPKIEDFIVNESPKIMSNFVRTN